MTSEVQGDPDDRPMSAADILRHAKALINTPKKWARNMYARDIHGDAIGTNHPEAVAWCMAGACRRAAGNSGIYITHIRPLVERAIGNVSLGSFNDNARRTHAEVMAAFDRAIELAETPS